MEQEPGTQVPPAFSLARRYAAAPEKVWRAWTDPEAVKRWWGPGPQDPVSLAELDVRVGGRFRIVFGGPQGRDHECAGEYLAVERPRKLAFSWCWPNSTPDRISQVTILLHRTPEGSTDLEFRHEKFFDVAARDGHRRGWTESLAKLGQYLDGVASP